MLFISLSAKNAYICVHLLHSSLLNNTHIYHINLKFIFILKKMLCVHMEV